MAVQKSIPDWWSKIEVWNHVLVYDGPDYLMLFWVTK